VFSVVLRAWFVPDAAALDATTMKDLEDIVEAGRLIRGLMNICLRENRRYEHSNQPKRIARPAFVAIFVVCGWKVFGGELESSTSHKKVTDVVDDLSRNTNRFYTAPVANRYS
jgi:hypothetical protein